MAVREFARIGLGMRRFLSIPADSPHLSFCLSQYMMMKEFVHSGDEEVSCFEDDVVFRNWSHLPFAFYELPRDWQILYLGANITDGVFGIKEEPPEKYSRSLYRLRKAWTTHAIIYRREAAQDIVKNYDPAAGEMYDNWISYNILPKYPCFLVNPMICYQRPGKSDLWGRETDYSGAFEWGDKFMST